MRSVFRTEASSPKLTPEGLTGTQQEPFLPFDTFLGPGSQSPCVFHTPGDDGQSVVRVESSSCDSPNAPGL